MNSIYISSRHLFQLVMAHFQIGYCYVDPARGLYRFSPELYALFGRPPSDRTLTLDDIEVWMAREDVSAMRALHHVIILKLLPPPTILNVVHPTGATRQIQIRFEAVRVSMDTPTFILALAKDVTQSASQATALKVTSRRLKTLSELATHYIDSLFFFDRSGRISAAYARGLPEPASPESASPEPVSPVRPVAKRIPAADLALLASARQPPGTRRQFTMAADGDETSHAWTVAAFPVTDDDDTVAEYVGLASESPYSLSFLSDQATQRHDILTAMTGQLVRGARAIAALTTSELCRLADISPSTLAKIEDETGPVVRITKLNTAAKILTALENAGVGFGFSQDGKLALCVD